MRATQQGCIPLPLKFKTQEENRRRMASGTARIDVFGDRRLLFQLSALMGNPAMLVISGAAVQAFWHNMDYTMQIAGITIEH